MVRARWGKRLATVVGIWRKSVGHMLCAWWIAPNSWSVDFWTIICGCVYTGLLESARLCPDIMGWLIRLSNSYMTPSLCLWVIIGWQLGDQCSRWLPWFVRWRWNSKTSCVLVEPLWSPMLRYYTLLPCVFSIYECAQGGGGWLLFHPRAVGLGCCVPSLSFVICFVLVHQWFIKICSYLLEGEGRNIFQCLFYLLLLVTILQLCRSLKLLWLNINSFLKFVNWRVLEKEFQNAR